MPQKARDGPGSRGAATDKEATQNKEHRDRKEPKVVPSFSEDSKPIHPEPSQCKAVGKNHAGRQGEPEEAESIAVWIERLSKVWPPLKDGKVGETHPASGSRNHAATGSAPAVAKQPSNVRKTCDSANGTDAALPVA